MPCYAVLCMEANESTVTLAREPWAVPETMPFGETP
jgi:hypothetical protein